MNKFLVTLVALMLPVSANAGGRVAEGFSTDWNHLKVEKRTLAPNVFLLHASGGNSVVVTGSNGVLIVDPSFAQVAPTLKKALKEMQAGPVRYVIDTHHHSDHSGANGNFAAEGAVTICQDNCRSHMFLPQINFLGKLAASPLPASLPLVTYDHSMTIFFEGEKVVLFHPRRSHTDDDTIVYLRNANVVHMGDIFVNKLYPFYDRAAGGMIDGYMPVIDEVLAQIDDKTKVIPGHGPVATKQDLKAYRNMVQTVRDRVAAGIAAGETLEKIIASHPSKEFDAENATNRLDGDGFTAVIYQSLTGKAVAWQKEAP